MMFGSGSTTSFAWLWLLGAAALIGLIAGLVVLLLSRSSDDEAGTILASRLARGEIDQHEYARGRAALGPAQRRAGMVRLGGVLALISLVAILALGGLTMAGAWPRPGPASAGPGASGFVVGTAAAPRVVRIIAGPGLRFYPDVVPILAGETITFEVTTMGMTTHEFMVGPSADVAADTEGTPEVADIGIMQTKSVTYTFTGSGPFAFACHAPGHFEAGMKGTIAIQP
jgi:plastocyanin